MRYQMILGCLLAVIPAGCASVDKHYVPVPTQETVLVKARQFSEIPVPPGLVLQVTHNESGSFEAGRTYKWGNFHYRGRALMAPAIDFIKEQMAQYEWDLVEDSSPGQREHFLKLAKGCYVAAFNLQEQGADLYMHVQVNTRYR